MTRDDWNTPYYRDNLYVVLRALYETKLGDRVANSGDWFVEMLGLLKSMGASEDHANRYIDELVELLGEKIERNPPRVAP